MKPFELKDRKIVVTGGSKGIGAAVTEMLLEFGAELIVVARNEEHLYALKRELHEKNPSNAERMHTLAADVTSLDGREAILDAVNRLFGESLHGLVNNAGTNIRKAVQDYSEEEWRLIFELNQVAPFELSRLLFSHLQIAAPKASVVNVASVAGTQDVGSGTPYAMTKSAMIQMSRSLASEWGRYPIRVNTVSPWYTKTPLVEPVMQDAKKMERIMSRTPMNRIAEAEEMASVVAFCLMDASSYMSGQNLIIDGALSAFAL